MAHKTARNFVLTSTWTRWPKLCSRPSGFRLLAIKTELSLKFADDIIDTVMSGGADVQAYGPALAAGRVGRQTITRAAAPESTLPFRPS